MNTACHQGKYFDPTKLAYKGCIHIFLGVGLKSNWPCCIFTAFALNDVLVRVLLSGGLSLVLPHPWISPFFLRGKVDLGGKSRIQRT